MFPPSSDLVRWQATPKGSANTPEGFEDTFGTYRSCLQLAADHRYLHRGQLADARRRRLEGNAARMAVGLMSNGPQIKTEIEGGS